MGGEDLERTSTDYSLQKPVKGSREMGQVNGGFSEKGRH